MGGTNFSGTLILTLFRQVQKALRDGFFDDWPRFASVTNFIYVLSLLGIWVTAVGLYLRLRQRNKVRNEVMKLSITIHYIFEFRSMG